MDHGSPISYEVLQPGTPVLSSDGHQVGTVVHVLADENEDVFDGIVIDEQRGPGGHRFADADDVDRIYEHAVVLKIDREAAGQLHVPSANPAVMRDDPSEGPPSGIQAKLMRAWDLLSGKY